MAGSQLSSDYASNFDKSAFGGKYMKINLIVSFGCDDGEVVVLVNPLGSMVIYVYRWHCVGEG